MPSLRNTQDLFLKGILGHRSILNNLIYPERFAVYSDGYVARLHRALKETYVACENLLSEDLFLKLAKSYIQDHPSNSYNLNRYGEVFPKFLKDSNVTKSKPWLTDLANLEWLISESFHAHVDCQLDLPLGEYLKVKWTQLYLSLNDSCVLLESEWPVHAIWKLAKQNEIHQAHEPKKIFLFIYRIGDEVIFNPISKNQHAFLHLVHMHHSLETCLEQCPDLNESEITNLFQLLSKHQLVESIELVK
ncbi:MAG: putative DNA-binding domain-containing protein [Bdellovibrionales bacterium]|nr:putative DNA-binding domain-containing protein [Bdellovibrionales bacterium]